MPLTWLPRKIRAMIATIAMSARIRAYSARPWPSSSRRSEARTVLMSAMCGSPYDDDDPHRTEGVVNIGKPLGIDYWADGTGGPPGPSVPSAACRGVDRGPDGAEEVGQRPAEDAKDHRRERGRQGQDQAVLDDSLAALPPGPSRTPSADHDSSGVARAA